MSTTVRTICPLILGCLLFTFTGCLPTSTSGGDDEDAASMPQQDASSSDSGQGEDSSTQDTTSGEDASGTQDAGTEDTGPNEDDTSDPVDTGNPQQRDCENGPLDAPVENCSPAPLPSTGDPREDCVRRINQFRWECQCLPPLERWHQGEQCADQQAAYDEENNQYHAGFSEGICSPRGRAQNECPGYGTWDRVIGTCLQQMWDEGPGEPFSEHGHYINMSSTQYTKVACGSGDTWFVQNFR